MVPNYTVDYFSVHEFQYSYTAERLGIVNRLPKSLMHNYLKLHDVVLMPARIALNQPIIINSGYRCEALNKAIKGVPTSYHLQGRAADIRPQNSAYLLQLFHILQGLPHIELIKYDTFVHVAL